MFNNDIIYNILQFNRQILFISKDIIECFIFDYYNISYDDLLKIDLLYYNFGQKTSLNELIILFNINTIIKDGVLLNKLTKHKYIMQLILNNIDHQKSIKLLKNININNSFNFLVKINKDNIYYHHISVFLEKKIDKKYKIKIKVSEESKMIDMLVDCNKKYKYYFIHDNIKLELFNIIKKFSNKNTLYKWKKISIVL